jgi:hypothetical protein
MTEKPVREKLIEGFYIALKEAGMGDLRYRSDECLIYRNGKEYFRIQGICAFKIAFKGRLWEDITEVEYQHLCRAYNNKIDELHNLERNDAQGLLLKELNKLISC